jgi:intracellular septation protein A
MSSSDTASDADAHHHAGGPRLAEVLPALRRGGVRFLFAGALPVASFYVAFKLGGPVVGILTGMVISLTALGVQVLRTRRLDPIVVVPMLVILIQGSLAMLTGSIDLYLAAPAVEAVLWGLVLIGSALLKRPLVPIIARELGVVPIRFSDSTGLRRSLELLTLAWGIAAFFKAGLRVYLLMLLPLEAFLIAITLGTSIVNMVMLGLSVWLPLTMVRREPRPGAA